MRKIALIVCTITLGILLAACGGNVSNLTSSASSSVGSEKVETSQSSSEQETGASQSTKTEDKQEKSKLATLVEGMDQKTGVHMRYDQLVEGNGFDFSYDIYAKGNSLYSKRTGTIRGHDTTELKITVDGKVFNVYEDQNKAMYVTSASALDNNQLMQDTLFQKMYVCAHQDDVIVEERELDGAQYTVELFPASNEYETDVLFYFDQEGKLAFCKKEAYSGSANLPEEFYTIHAIDNAVDDSLFDLSGYEIDNSLAV